MKVRVTVCVGNSSVVKIYIIRPNVTLAPSDTLNDFTDRYAIVYKYPAMQR